MKKTSESIPQQERFPGNDVPGMEYTTARPIDWQNGMPADPIPPTKANHGQRGEGSFAFCPNEEK